MYNTQMIPKPKFTDFVIGFIVAILLYGAIIGYSYVWAYNFKNDYITEKNPQLQDYPKLPVNKNNKKYTLRKPKYAFTLNRISAYTNSRNETDSTPYNTSCGHVNDVKNKFIIALSRDLFFRDGYKWLCGKHATIVYTDGTKIEGVIYDTMNARYRRTADVLIRKSNITIAKKAAFDHGAKVGKILIY